MDHVVGPRALRLTKLGKANCQRTENTEAGVEKTWNIQPSNEP